MSKFYLPESSATSTRTASSPLNSPPDPISSYKPSTYSSYENSVIASDNEDDDIDTLPYPEELPRSDFLSPDFDAQKYLSTLHNRHQTLEDLRSDLRSRSQLLSRELLDLVNSNYEEFLSLGSTLKGGDEKVENVKLGVLAFQRQIEGVRDVVAAKEREVRDLLDEKRLARKHIQVGRKLLEIDERLSELEARLMIEPDVTKDDDNDDDEETDYDEYEDKTEDIENESAEARAANAIVARLRKHAQLYLLLQHMIQQIGPDHPFIVAQQTRTLRIRNTLLLDLRAALRQAKKEGRPAGARTLRIASIYRALGEGEELMSALKGS